MAARFSYDIRLGVRSLLPGPAAFAASFFVTSIFASACAPPRTAETHIAKEAATELETEPARASYELTADEVFVRDGLKRHVKRLAQEIGERNGQKGWELADAADYLASELESLGYAVDRQGFEVGAVAAQNLSVTVRGGQRGDQVFIVGAHYDSPPAEPGFEAALSTAAVLELARMMQGAKLERTLRFVFFAVGESTGGDPELRGANRYARKAVFEAKGPRDVGLPEAVRKASALENFGVLTVASLGDLTTHAPAGRLVVPVGSDAAAWKLKSVLAQSFHDEAVELSSVPLNASDGDARSFSDVGIPALEIGEDLSAGPTQSGFSERQFDQAAIVVMRIRQALGDILIERATNDGMVTPGTP